MRAAALLTACVAAWPPLESGIFAAGREQAPSPAAGIIGLGVNGAATFDVAWQAIRDSFVDDAKSDADWTALRDEFRPRAAAARSDDDLRGVLREMLARLGRSHFDILPAGAPPPAADSAVTADATGDVGLEVTPIDGEPVVTRVIAGGPARRRSASRLDCGADEGRGSAPDGGNRRKRSRLPPVGVNGRPAAWCDRHDGVNRFPRFGRT